MNICHNLPCPAEGPLADTKGIKYGYDGIYHVTTRIANRAMYEKMLGRPWAEMRAALESMYADKLPDDVSPETLKEWLDDYDGKKACSWTGAGVYRASQTIRVTMRMFSGA